ncbi:hypothetical protein VIGAN_11237300, partial [Vigna angularis var. angularis]
CFKITFFVIYPTKQNLLISPTHPFTPLHRHLFTSPNSYQSTFLHPQKFKRKVYHSIYQMNLQTMNKILADKSLQS